MAIPAFLVAAGKGIVVGAKTVAVWIANHGAVLATAATGASIALTGNTFEGKKKRVTFGKSDSIVAGKHSFQVPQIHVEDVRYTKNASSQVKSKNTKYSRKKSKK